MRAMKLRRDGTTSAPHKRPAPRQNQSGADENSLRGGVKKLLGRAAAGKAQMQARGKPNGAPAKGPQRGGSGMKPPESFVFEGHRASSTQGNKALKLGGARKKKGGKPKNPKRAGRAAAWKKGEVKKSSGN